MTRTLEDHPWDVEEESCKTAEETESQSASLRLCGRKVGSGALRDELVFKVREYTEVFGKRYINESLGYNMAFGDCTAGSRQNIQDKMYKGCSGGLAICSA